MRIRNGDAEENARFVAESLAAEFLRAGNYTASTGPIEIENVPGIRAAAVQAAAVDDVRGFEGLAVQSVGYERGAEEPAVHIYLTRGSTRQTAALPGEIRGVSIVVHKMGAISVRPEIASSATNRGNLFERNARVCCGSSCAPTSENSTGTLGAIVRKANALYLLSNNHVLAGCNHVPRDQPIMAPSSGDGRPDITAPREIGRHSEIHELRTGEPNFVAPVEIDAALARVTNPAVVCSWQGDGTGFDTPTVTTMPVAGMRVKKFGRTTGFTQGEVEAYVPTATPIGYNAKYFKGTVYFQNVWTVKSAGAGAFALPGDSGSLVVNENGTRAVGLLFAANRTGDYGWIIPIDPILAAFGGARLVATHGC
jgi:hypothetical protein